MDISGVPRGLPSPQPNNVCFFQPACHRCMKASCILTSKQYPNKPHHTRMLNIHTLSPFISMPPHLACLQPPHTQAWPRTRP